MAFSQIENPEVMNNQPPNQSFSDFSSNQTNLYINSQREKVKIFEGLGGYGKI
jgi:hypothetical protein